ncbi:MAG: putative oxidoreductase protein [Frankiales bacterium]|nr:putative oxidoreductase protein [Frankiales bacterium]
MTRWQPVALSGDVPSHAPIGVRLHGEDLVLWRDPSGRVHAWPDRCPHRGMRLSLGFLRDGKLACPYHGWRFGPDGRCVHVPAHPDLVPAGSVAVERHPAHESHAMVWVSTEPGGSPATAAERFRPIRSVTVRRCAAEVLDGLGAAFAGFQADGAGALGQQLYRLPTDSGLLAIGVQVVTPEVTALHAAHAGPAGDEFLAAWGRRLAEFRTALESAP